MFDRLREAVAAGGEPPTSREPAELLWLACHTGPPAVDAAAPDPPPAVPVPVPVPAPEPPAVPNPPPAPAPAPAEPPRDELRGAPAPAETGPAVPSDAVLVPAAPTLPHTLGLQRSLRPLKRRVASTRRSVIDEVATAERIATYGSRVPVLRPAPERRLSLSLVVDGGPSMRIWRSLGDELAELLTRLGAFRYLRRWEWTDLGLTRSGDAYVGPQALLDPSGRQVVLVLSDCSGPHWWSGQAARDLELWGRHGPVAIVQPLAERLWSRTAAAPVPGLATALSPGGPNTGLRFTPYDRDGGSGLPVPVLELGEGWLRDWALLVAGAAHDVPTVVTRTRPSLAADPLLTERELPVAEQAARFRAAASPEAVRLAAHIAVSVPSLGVMRLIQHRFVPSSTPGHLAEVLLSGLLHPTDSGNYAFTPGAREALLPALPRSEARHTAAVLDALSATVSARAGRTGRLFRAYLASPSGRTPADDRPFALVNDAARRYLTNLAIPGPGSGTPIPEEARPPDPARSYVLLQGPSRDVGELLEVLQDPDLVGLLPHNCGIAGFGLGSFRNWAESLRPADLLVLYVSGPPRADVVEEMRRKTMEQVTGSRLVIFDLVDDPAAPVPDDERARHIDASDVRTGLDYYEVFRIRGPDLPSLGAELADIIREGGVYDDPALSVEEILIRLRRRTGPATTLLISSGPPRLRLTRNVARRDLLEPIGPGDQSRYPDEPTADLQRTLQNHTGPVYAVAVGPDGTWLASGSDDGTVRVWDRVTGRTVAVLQGHTDWVRAVAVGPDGTWTTSPAGTVTGRSSTSTTTTAIGGATTPNGPRSSPPTCGFTPL